VSRNRQNAVHSVLRHPEQKSALGAHAASIQHCAMSDPLQLCMVTAKGALCDILARALPHYGTTSASLLGRLDGAVKRESAKNGAESPVSFDIAESGMAEEVR
jgi:hypothetical protein